MCGIAGVLNCPRDVALRATRGMVEAMRHRGPDGTSVELVHEEADGSSVVFGATRLAILDLSRNGDQPMRDEESGRTVVHNGEIYNVVALRDELKAHGQRFTSTGDTEVVLRAFNVWGEDCVRRFRGMFASAIWDGRTRQVYLVRDRLGIKPLYYARGRRGEWLFASEINALLASNLVDRATDPVAIDSFFAHGAVRAPRTVLAAARALMPAHTVSLSHAGLGRPRRYWDLASCRADDQFDRNAEIKLRDKLLAAVEAHLVSDVSVGLFLSGGIDSSTLAALTSRIARRALPTFSLAFDSAGYDERRYATAVADRWNTDHHEQILGRDSASELVESALGAMDQPSIDGFNAFAVSRFARDHGLKVVLSGLGGDEVFGGYATFKRVPTIERFGRIVGYIPGASALAASVGRRFRDERGDARVSRILRIPSTGGRVLAAYLLSRELFSPLTRLRLLGQDYSSAFHDDDADIECRLEHIDSFRQVSLLEMELYMGNMLLRDADVMGMANSLEIRVPMLDHLLLEQVWAFSTAVKSHGEGRKALLIGSMRHDLPDTIVNRPKKGFTLPWPDWTASTLRSHLRETFNNLECLDGMMDVSAVKRLADGMFANSDPRSWSRVWALYVAARWFERTRQAQPMVAASA